MKHQIDDDLNYEVVVFSALIDQPYQERVVARCEDSKTAHVIQEALRIVYVDPLTVRRKRK